VDAEKTKVAPSTTYVAQVTLRPATGYTFEAGSTVVSFGGDTLTAISKDATPEDNNWAQMTENGSIKVSHEFTSSADTLKEIVDPASVNAEYGKKVSDVEDLPREVQIVTENGKSNTDVTWVEDGKVVVVKDDGTEETTDAAALKSKREAHTVVIVGTVTIPEGTTLPEGMEATTRLTIKVAADPRLALEEKAVETIGDADDAVTAAKAADIEEPTDLIQAVEDAKEDLSTYKDNLDESTPEGLVAKTKELQDAIDALNSYVKNNGPIEVTIFPVKKKLTEGKLVYDVEFPAEINTTDDAVKYDDRRQEAEWLTEDKKVKSAENYIAEVILSPAKGTTFNVGRHINFNGVTIAITETKPAIEEGNESTYAYAYFVDEPEGAICVGRTFRSMDAKVTGVDDPATASAEFGTEPKDVEMPATVGLSTDDPQKSRAEAEIEWDMSPYAEDYNNRNNADAVREAHEVEVTGTLKAVSGVADAAGTEVKTTISIAADPRLEKEATAVALDEEAKTVIEKAQNMGIGADEIAALETSLQEMRDEVSVDNLANSTPESDQEKIDAVNTDLNALKKAISDKEEADRKAAEEADRQYVNAGKKTILVAKGVASGATDINLSWNNVSADRYLVYFTKCDSKGKTYPFKVVKTVNGKTFKWTKTKLAKNTPYKFYVVAQKKSGNGYKTIAKSLDGHVYTGNEGGKYTNPSKLTIKPTSLTLKVGKASTIKGTVSKAKSSKALGTNHVKKLRFASTNPRIATVNASGKVTAKHKGSCKIYVQTINGIWKTVTVTVE
jgi:hypothetical protein